MAAKKNGNGVTAAKSVRNGQAYWDVTGLLVCRVKPDISLKAKEDKARAIEVATAEFLKVKGTATVIVDLSDGMVVATMVSSKDGLQAVPVKEVFNGGPKPAKKVAKKVAKKAAKKKATKKAK